MKSRVRAVLFPDRVVRVLVILTMSAVSGAPVLAATDPCLTGTWRGEVSQARELFQSMSPTAVTELGGVVTLDIGANGATDGRIDGLHIDLEQDRLILVNAAEGTFAVQLDTAGSTLTGRFTAFDVETRAELRGPEGFPPQILKEPGPGVTGMPQGTLTAEYTCDATTLTITTEQPEQMPIRVWSRQ